MDDYARKQKRTDNESNRKRQKRKLRISTDPADRKREEQQGKPNRKHRPKQYKVPSSTTLYDLPLEILDIILQKSYLHWILNSSTKQRDEEVIKSFTSVDVCFNRRITRQRYKNAIWRYLKDYYGKTKKKSAIIRNNRNYLMKYIQPNDELIDSLLSLSCITEEQRHFIQRQRSNQNKNAQLLRVVRSFDDKKFSNFVMCLRQMNQTAVARIVENGGAVIKGKVNNNCRTTLTESMDPQLLHQIICNLQSRSKPRSHQTDKLISQLKDEGIEILNSQLNRQTETVVIWIWCQSQAALQYIQGLYESNQLTDILFHFANIRPPASEIIQPNVINIDSSQFKKKVVVCPISVNVPERIHVGRTEEIYGVTKLRNGIYVLCRSDDSPDSNVICVFEDRNPFRLQKKIAVKEIKYPEDIASSEKENCLYVAELKEKCVWKIIRATSHQHKIIRWLTTDYKPSTLSVSRDGRLLVVIWKSSILMIYGSGAELSRSIQSPGDIVHPRHAVETSVGNFIILHQWMGDEEGDGWSSDTVGETMWAISEVTRDGHMVIRRFVLSNETQKLNNYPKYLSLDSDDRVFVADYWHDRLILLDSDLKWNRNLCPSKEEEEKKNRFPWSMCYDEGEKHLIVGELKRVNVYTLRQN